MKTIFGDQKSRFSIRKYSIGVASVLLSTLVFGMGTAQADQIEAVDSQNQASVSEVTSVPIENSPTSSSEVTLPEVESSSTPQVVNEETSSQPVTSSMPRRQGYTAPAAGTTFLNASENAGPTFEKTGDEIKVTNPDVVVNFPEGAGKYSKFEVEYKKIDIPDDIPVNQGDKVILTLPETVRFQTSYEFDVHNPENQVVGKAVADAQQGTVTTTFNDYFNTHPIKKSMSLKLDVRWTDQVVSGKPIEANFNGTLIHVDIAPERGIPEGEVIDKWGSQDKDDPTIINWAMRINSSRRLLNNVRIIDTMSENQVLVDDYLVINYVDSVEPWVDKGSAMELVKSISKSEHGFEIKMDRLDRMIYLWYKAKLVKPVKESTNPTNSVQVLAEDMSESDSSRVQLVGGRGDASGDLSTPNPITYHFELSKSLEGRKLANQEFSFKVEDITDAAKPVELGSVQNDAAGKIESPEIKVSKAGTYKYRVTEVPGAEAEMVYDPMIAEITVEVTQEMQGNQAILVANITYPEDKEFNNKLATPAKANIEFTKELTKAGIKQDLTANAFQFVLKNSAGEVVDTVGNQADGRIQFRELTFDKMGTYTYTVEEVDGQDEDIVYDKMKATVTITIDRNGDALISTITNPVDTEFNNRVKDQEAGKAKFEFTKVLAGRDLKAGEFSFVLKDENGKELQTVTNTGDGKVSFDELSYDKSGTYKYTISEVAGTDASIEYDKMVAEVTVTVTKEIGAEKNTFIAVKALPADTEFNNTYTPPTAAKANIEFTKDLAGRDLKADEFSFVLKDAEGKEVERVTNTADGKVKFKELTFKEAGTYTYSVEEVAGSDEDLVYDPMVATVTIKVTKDGNAFVATVTNPADTEFNNRVKDQEAGEAKFEFTKVLAGRDLKAGEFSFVLKDENGKELQTVTNTADGKVSFDEISYDKSGTYKYTISEVSGSDVSIEYDKMVAEVTVTVTKEIGAEKNTFVAVKTLPADTEFNNTYIAPTKAQFTFTKALSGRTLVDKEFMFALFERNENGEDIFLGFAQNDANGRVAFDEIAYDTEGTHTYYVVEVIGNDRTVTYDRMEAEVTVSVAKDVATNSLKATVVMPEDSEFNNSVTPPMPPSPYIPPKPGEPTPPTPPSPYIPPKPVEPTPPTPPSPTTPPKPVEPTPPSKMEKKDKSVLPNTGSETNLLLTGAGILALAGLAYVGRRRRED